MTLMALWSQLLWPRSLRGQLVVLTLALAVPLLVLQVWWGLEQFRSAELAADEQALVVAEATAASIRQVLQVSERQLEMVVERHGVGWVRNGICEDAVQELLPLLPFAVNLVVLDVQGDLKCSARAMPEGGARPRFAWLSSLRATERFTVGDPTLGALTQAWILPVAMPVFDEDGALVGAVGASLPLLEFQPVVEAREQGEDQLVTIATADRVVIARSHEPERWIGQLLPPPNPGDDQEVAPGRAVARGADFEGIERVWGQVETVNGWTVYVGSPADAVLAPARARFGRVLGVTLLIILVAITLAGLSYRRIARALEELAGGKALAASGTEAGVFPEGTPQEVRSVVAKFRTTLDGERRAEAAERAARERFESIFDNAVFGLYVSTPDGRFLQVNPALVTMLGYESADALIEAGPKALYPNPDTRAELIDAAQGLGTIEGWEVDWLTADGLPITVRLSGRAISLDGGPAFEMIVEDITEEKRRESELRQTQKMEAIGKLAGGISHDFNNLLTVIGGNLELIEDGLPEDDPIRADLDQIREATKRASTLTNQLLAFARREPKGARAVNVNQVIADLEGLLERLIGEEIKLTTRLVQVGAPIMIDPSELEQIIMNLVLNARDAMPDGGSVVVETRRAPMERGTLTDPRAEEGVLLSVRDTGVGMDAETSKRIFEPFYTTKPLGKGTGLGLSTVYGIVQGAGGQIGVESEPGRGTTIGVWFPLAAIEAAQAIDQTELQSADGGSESILVVEDEELVRMFVNRALKEAGYRVFVASDGQEALEMVEAGRMKLDLVLTDVVMPRLRGPELADRLGSLRPELPVLYMSGYMHNDALRDRLVEDPALLLRKPFSTTELCQRVRTVLDKRLATSL